MFIERLEAKDYVSFAKDKLNLSFVDIKQVKNGMYFRLLVREFGPSPEFVLREFVLRDFFCEGINNPISKENEIPLQKVWREFLAEKFGEEYKTACNSFLKKQYEDGLIK